MTTCPDKVFASTDIQIKINYEGILLSEISELYLKFVNRGDPTIYKTYLKSTGGITIVNDEIIVNVGKADITLAGIYDIYIKRTNSVGKEFGVISCPAWVKFHKMI